MYLKKSIATLVLAAMLAAPIAAPKRAEAIVGTTIPGGVGLAVAGGILLYLVATCTYNCSMAPFVALLGIVALDSDQGPSAAFGLLSDEEGRKLGIADVTAYNSELPEINSVRESITSDMVTKMQNGEAVTSEMIHDAWQAKRSKISADAFAALEKVSAQITASNL